MREMLIAGLFLGATAQAARADGVIYRLPEDGAQVRYELEITTSADGQDKSGKGSLTVSSVGQATVDNQKCRWIEIKLTVNEPEEHSHVIKTLVPENDLGKGKSPLDHVVRTWIKAGNGEATEVKDLKSPEAQALRLFLAGASKPALEVEKVEIDSKLGKLECAGVSGEYEVESGNGITGSVTYENRLHDKAPFGLVTALWRFEGRKNGQVTESGTFKLTLADTSTTALSKLPDKN